MPTSSGKFASENLVLSASATALLFKLSRKMTEGEFIEILHSFCGPIWQMQLGVRKPYDFIHLPWSKLAVVNFTSPKACGVCFEVLKLVAGRPGVCVTDVCEALQQGLAPNLAHFCAKCQQSSKVSLPLVFIDGHSIPPLLACQLLVSDSLLQQSIAETSAPKQRRLEHKDVLLGRSRQLQGKTDAGLFGMGSTVLIEL